jgi:hypothetical protein
METDLAFVEDVDSGAAATENLRVVLVNGALGVADGRHILDHDDVIRVLALGFLGPLCGTRLRRLEEQWVGSDHVIDDATLADLLALELALSREVVAVVVAEVVVRRNRQGLDASVDKELSKDRLELGLSGLQIVATDERLALLGELNDARDEGVLGSTVDKWFALENRGDSE